MADTSDALCMLCVPLVLCWTMGSFEWESLLSKQRTLLPKSMSRYDRLFRFHDPLNALGSDGNTIYLSNYLGWYLGLNSVWWKAQMRMFFILLSWYVLSLWSITNIFIFPHNIQIQKGASSARSDDTKSLKGAILDWITPRGQPLNPPLARNVKVDRGFHHERTGALLCPAGLDWSNAEYVFSSPLELYAKLLQN